MPVILVEAEKSALAVDCAAARAGRAVLAVALGGCFGWRGRIGQALGPDGDTVDEVGVLPDFDRVTWAAREVVLAFDANASTNPKVQAARRGLGLSSPVVAPASASWISRTRTASTAPTISSAGMGMPRGGPWWTPPCRRVRPTTCSA